MAKSSELTDFSSLPPSMLPPCSPVLRISQKIAELSHSLRHLKQEMADAARRGSATVARHFVLLHLLKSDMDILEKQFSELFSRYNNIVVPAALEVAGVTNVPLAEGYRVGVANRLWVSIKPGAQAPGHFWLKTQGLGSIIVPSVNSQTLSAAIKEHIDETNEEPPIDLFTLTLAQTTSVTRIK